LSNSRAEAIPVSETSMMAVFMWDVSVFIQVICFYNEYSLSCYFMKVLLS